MNRTTEHLTQGDVVRTWVLQGGVYHAVRFLENGWSLTGCLTLLAGTYPTSSAPPLSERCPACVADLAFSGINPVLELAPKARSVPWVLPASGGPAHAVAILRGVGGPLGFCGTTVPGGTIALWRDVRRSCPICIRALGAVNVPLDVDGRVARTVRRILARR